MSRFKPHLQPSPLTTLRCKYHLTMAEAADKLGVTTLCVARIESKTQRISAAARRQMNEKLSPPPPYVQLSIMDYLADLEASDS